MRTPLKPEQWLYLLFVAMLPFASVPELLGYHGGLQVSDLILAVAGLVWLISLLARKRNFVWSNAYIFLAAYAVAVTLSAIFSISPEQSLVKLAGKFYLIAIVFLTINFFTSLDELRKALLAWLSGSSLVVFLSLAGIALFYIGLTDPKINLVVHPIFGSLPPGYYPRIEGFFRYPSLLCSYLSISLALLVLSYLAGWLRRRYAIAFGICLLIVDAFTLTPGLGGLFLAGGILIWVRSKTRLAGRLAFASGILAAAAFVFISAVTFVSYSPEGSRVPIADGEITRSHRAEAWRTSFESFLQHPVLGRGIDMPVAESRFIDPSGNRQLLTDAHNTYLSVLAETGLVGFVALAALVIFLFASLLRMRHGEGSTALASTIVLVALVDVCLYQGLTGSYEDSRHLWAFFGIGAALIRFCNSDELSQKKKAHNVDPFQD